MADSIALAELKRLYRLLAEAAAEARDNPVGAITQYTRGMARAGLELAKVAVMAAQPATGLMTAQMLDNALRPALNPRPPAVEGQADLTADPSPAGEVGEIIGPPMPGGGADKAAIRKIFTKIYDQTLLQQIEDAAKRGMTKEDIFQRFGAAKHEGITNDWVQELPGQLKIKRNWNAREVTAPLGEFVDYPELYAALKRYGISDPETIPVRRLRGAQGHYQSAADAANRAAVGELAFGDMDMLYVAGHELQHLVDHTQTGIAAGAGAKEAVDAYLAGPGKTLANKLGIQNGQDLDRAFFKNPAPEVQKLFNAAWQHYHNNPGELLADISGARSQMSPSPSARGYPFTIIDHFGPKSGRAFYDAGAIRHEQAFKYGLDMTDPTKGVPNANYGDIGASVDSLDQFFTRPDRAKLFSSWVKAHPETQGVKRWFEPSAGEGSILRYFPGAEGMDLEPKAAGIRQGDFLKLKMSYDPEKGYVGNPPFGPNAQLAVAFLNKSLEEAPLAAFILPRGLASPRNQARVTGGRVVDQVLLPRDSFYTPDGEAKKVNTVAQIWKRGEPIEPPKPPLRFSSVAKGDETHALDSLTGRLKPFTGELKASTLYGKLDPDEVKLLSRADWSPLRDYNTGNYLNITNTAIDNVLRGLEAAPRIPRLRKEEDLQALFEALINSRD